MTATILQFPPFAVRIVREDDVWLVLAARGHGWLHGSRSEAAADAVWLSRNHGVPVHPRAGGDRSGG
jgi:hypothetical protein